MAYVPPHRRRRRQQQQQGAAPQTHDDGDDADDRCSILRSMVDYIWVINLDERRDKWEAVQRQVADAGISEQMVERFSAVNGAAALRERLLEKKESTSTKKNCDDDGDADDDDDDVCLEWDATQNSHYSPRSVAPGPRTMTAGEVGCALSHVALWRRLLAASTTNDNNSTNRCKRTTALILEDDVVFTKHPRTGQSRFLAALKAAWELLPRDFNGILYLGFSSRGKRTYLERMGPYQLLKQQQQQPQDPRRPAAAPPSVQLYRPEYGYHTQAYILTRDAAAVLLEHRPVAGPVDVWLADHDWFGLDVYCAVIAGEGWRDRHRGGAYEGAPLVTQNRCPGFRSDVPQSSSAASSSPPPPTSSSPPATDVK